MALFGYVSDFIQRKITDSSRFFFLAHLFINCKCVLDLYTHSSVYTAEWLSGLRFYKPGPSANTVVNLFVYFLIICS